VSPTNFAGIAPYFGKTSDAQVAALLRPVPTRPPPPLNRRDATIALLGATTALSYALRRKRWYRRGVLGSVIACGAWQLVQLSLKKRTRTTTTTSTTTTTTKDKKQE
jgi:hypothetical protein